MSMDFPQAFEFIESTEKEDHHRKCSWRAAGLLCDCSVIWAEYYKRSVADLQAEIDRLKGVNEVLMRERNFDPGAANVLSGFIAERNRWMTECDRLKALCEWRPITADDLPRLGDEVAGEFSVGDKVVLLTAQDRMSYQTLTLYGYTHFRPISAPVQP